MGNVADGLARQNGTYRHHSPEVFLPHTFSLCIYIYLDFFPSNARFHVAPRNEDRLRRRPGDVSGKRTPVDPDGPTAAVTTSNTRNNNMSDYDYTIISHTAFVVIVAGTQRKSIDALGVI